jgi:hypothetical protein
VAGVAAIEESDGSWSLTRDELAKVIQAAFLFPSTWADLTGSPSQQTYEHLRKSDFFSFFHIIEAGARPVGSSTEIILKPGGFQESIELAVSTDANKRVTGASLGLRHYWVIGPPMGVNPLAIDIVKSFLLAVAPPQDRDDIVHLAETLLSLRDLKAMRPTLEDPEFAQSIEGRFISAYIGNAPFDLSLNYCRVSVEAEPRDGQPWIGIQITVL